MEGVSIYATQCYLHIWMTPVISSLISFIIINPRDYVQNSTTKLVALGLGNPPVSVPCNGEWKQLGSLAPMIHD